jgi:hypothetical protein
MSKRKPSVWVIAGIVLIIIGGVVLLPGATVRSALAQLPSEPPAPAMNSAILADFQSTALNYQGDPTSITVDEQGYTVWTYNNWTWDEIPWCVNFSRLRWPFNLGAQDPSELSETTLILNYGQRQDAFDEDGNSLYTDPTWAVTLNGDPGDWMDGAFTGDWNIIGAIGITPPRTHLAYAEQEVAFDYGELIDGENNLWLQQQDFCGTTSAPDLACTCYQLYSIKLRARVQLGIKSVSPAPDTRNVWPDQGQEAQDSEIRVKFTTLVSPTSVNENTFQVYYFDDDAYKVYADGDVKRISDVEYAFVPTGELLPVIQYFAQVWGENDASAYSYEAWVQDINGGPLEDGQVWTFWTLPDLEVAVKPVQVLEDMALIVNKPTTLRAFIRWDVPEGVFWKSVAPDVIVEDVTLTWLAPDDTVWNQARWSDGVQWQPALTTDTARHRREYREFTFEEESYNLREKRLLLDSFNYFGFTPTDTGMYNFEFTVWVKDSRGRSHPFRGYASTMAAVGNTFPIYMRAVGVGPDYGKTGTVDLSTLIRYNLRGMRTLYPVANVNWPAAPSAMTYYSPTTTGWLVDWTVKPWPPYYSEELYLLREMHALCVRTSGCWAMVGIVHKDWLNTPGNTQRESAPTGALVRNDSDNAGKRYVTAHEVGHLAHIDEHYEGPSGNGFDVIERTAKNAEQGYTDFMTALPEEIGDVSLWITAQHYTVIQQWIMDHYSVRAQQLVQPTFAQSADPLLLVDGVISPTTGAVTLLPWYQMDAGDYVPPLPGPYQLVFLDAEEQEIVGYTQSFTVNTTLRYAGEALTADDGPATFTFAAPYPAATAKAQIQRITVTDTVVLAEIIPAATPPTVTIQALPAVWTGSQALAWDATPGATYFALDISTDDGATWEAYALNLTAPVYMLETIALPNTTGALIRVAASDGLRTATAVAGPFTIDNPPLVGYVDPPNGADNVDVWTAPLAGFRDPMNPTSIHSTTFTLAGGPLGAVTGVISYNVADREATFTPAVPLAYATRYTATLTTGIFGVNGENLPLTHTWTFTTTPDTTLPSPVVVSPHEGALHVPRNVVLAVAWDRDLNPSTLTTNTFQLATAVGTPISGSVNYDAATCTATFAPAADLLTDTLYIATLKSGIASTGGYITTGDFNWAFTTGSAPGEALAFTGSYADWGYDADGDGLYEQLVIRVGVQVTATGDYVLSGSLVDTDSGEIAWAYITPTLTTGAHFLDLAFDGAAIGGHGVNGPYTLTDLALMRLTSATPFWALASTSQRDVYRTFAYAVGRFPAPLRFGSLPDVLLIPGTTALNAFNVHDYVQHITCTSDLISYTMMLNTNPKMDVALQSSGAVYLIPEEYWQGSTLVTIRASDGVHTVQDTFEAAVGWPHAVYLPLVLRNYGGASVAAARDAWITLFADGFETDSWDWIRYTTISGPPDGPGGTYQWDKRDCRAYSGQYSAWPYGDGDDGELLSCGATYPNTLWSMMYRYMPVNLKYVAKGEYSAKVWTDLAPGAQVCLNVAVLESGYCQSTYGQPAGDYYGVCRTGQTDGWADLTLDLANVPTLGNVLGEERVCLSVDFYGGVSGTRPEGAYVDDVNVRVCPEGLTDNCAGSAGVAPPTTTPLVTGNIGGYPEEVSEVALAVDDAGRVYALWTGKLNPAFSDYVFYSSSADGVTWTPYQILSYWGGREPKIVVDNVHGRVHLAYANDDGIIHRIVEGGTISAPEIVAPQRTYYLPGFNLPSGGVAWPSLAVAEDTGVVYLTWDEVYYVNIAFATYTLRHRTWHAYWNNGTWSAPLRKINDEDTWDASIVAAPDGKTMLAWFQRWQQSSGGGIGPGDPIVARTAYGTELGSFPLRQATHDLYDVPQRDETILLAYSGGDDSFVLASDHFMWPGHSLAYRYIWKDGVWSEPLDVAENASGWGVPYYVGAATDTPLIRYVYNDNYVLTMRTEINGVLGPEQTIANYLSARDYTGSPLAYFTDAAGDLHMVISGEKSGVAGFYYVEP